MFFCYRTKRRLPRGGGGGIKIGRDFDPPTLSISQPFEVRGDRCWIGPCSFKGTGFCGRVGDPLVDMFFGCEFVILKGSP